MITRFFGLPGCGKTTIAAKLAFDALRSGLFAHVYGNVPISIPGYTQISFSYVGKYMLRDCCLIIDEAAIEASNRGYKSFGKEKEDFFMEHRHYDCRVFLFSQEPDGVDIKIRNLTDKMFYLKKGLLLGKWITTCYKIPYKLVWPSENSNGENLGKIVMGYVKPPFLSSLFAKRIYRPRYYPFFDSWQIRPLPPLPEDVVTIPGCITKTPGFWSYYRYTRSVLVLYARLCKLQRKERRKLRRSDRRLVEQQALVRSHAPTGINALPNSFRISA